MAGFSRSRSHINFFVNVSTPSASLLANPHLMRRGTPPGTGASPVKGQITRPKITDVRGDHVIQKYLVVCDQIWENPPVTHKK